ncbi:hypothetical protein [Kocuria palustris]|uniref:hypothetical protein n=1 Tax=Kocuria palustris TaxID=71999 RepID=UPI00077B70BF|nr:hypothetical protein [Kocuria palustris]
MSMTSKRYGFRVDGHWVQVLGETKAVHPEWSIVVDDQVVASQAASGKFQLEADVDGKALVARIQQGTFGDVSVEVTLGGDTIQSTSGFLL